MRKSSSDLPTGRPRANGATGRRLGRKARPKNDAARLIYEQIGPGKAVRSQAELRKLAGVGSRYLAELRRKPRLLSNDVLVRLADAAQVDPQELAETIDRELRDEDVERIRADIRMAPAMVVPGEAARTGVEAFFKKMGARAQTQGLAKGRFLQTVSFTAPPNMVSAGNVQREVVKLIRDGMCFGLYVPLPCKVTKKGVQHCAEGGIILERYRDVFERVKRLADGLVSKALEDGQEREQEIVDRVAVFVLHDVFYQRPNYIRILCPHDDSGRKFLVKFPPTPEEVDIVAAKWVPAGFGGGDAVEVLYDLSDGDSAIDRNRKNEGEAAILKEFFSYAIGLWDAGGGKRFANEADPDGLWQIAHLSKIFPGRYSCLETPVGG